MIEIVNVALPLTGIVPRDAVGVAPPLQVPWLTVQEVKVVDAGRVSITLVLDAAAVPILATVIVYVTLPPTATEAGLPVLVTARSATPQGSR